jgi:hypothetical protein
MNFVDAIGKIAHKVVTRSGVSRFNVEYDPYILAKLWTGLPVEVHILHVSRGLGWRATTTKTWRLV